MKTAFISLLAIILLASCSDNHSGGSAHETAHTGHTAAATADHAGLSLNGEERWQADAATNENIAQLQQLMQEYLNQPENSSIGNINQLGHNMQAGFDEVLKECRMKGPEHDMLHVYLMPMLDDVKAMKQPDLATATAARDRMAARLDEYQTYFK